MISSRSSDGSSTSASSRNASTKLRNAARLRTVTSSTTDPSGRVSVDYGVYGVPETYFIDRRGRVRFKQVGPVSDELLSRQIEALLAEAA